MADNDNTVALQATIPSIQDQLAPISGMIDLQQKSAQWRARQRLGKVLNDPANRDENGNLDLTKLMPAALAADPGNYYATDTIRGIADSRTANMNAIKARQDVMGNAYKYLSTASGASLDKYQNDPSTNLSEENHNNVMAGQKLGIIPPEMAGLMHDKTPTTPPQSAPTETIQAHNALMSNKFAQMAALGKQKNPLNNFSSYNPSSIDPNTGQPSGAPNTPAPTTVADLRKNVMMGATPEQQNAITYLNTGTRQIPVAASKLAIGGGGTGVENEPGKVANLVNTAATVGSHYADAVDDSNRAKQDIATLQDMKLHAHGAVTGVAADQRSYVAKLAGLLGMSVDQLKATQTDLLAKDQRLLALTGGNTDYAKTLAEGANPNYHMTEQAIQKVADRSIAMRQMAIEKQNYFSKLKANPDPNVYSAEIGNWNQHADTHVMQWPLMSKEEKQALADAYHSADPSGKKWTKFNSDYQWFKQKGIIK